METNTINIQVDVKNINEVKAYIEQLRTDNARLTAELAELRERTRWILVSERLPEVEEYACSVSVLVFRNGYTVAEAWYDFEEENWHKSNAIGMLIDGVTHWMLLPEPPEAE